MSGGKKDDNFGSITVLIYELSRLHYCEGLYANFRSWID